MFNTVGPTRYKNANSHAHAYCTVLYQTAKQQVPEIDLNSQTETQEQGTVQHRSESGQTKAAAAAKQACTSKDERKRSQPAGQSANEVDRPVRKSKQKQKQTDRQDRPEFRK